MPALARVILLDEKKSALAYKRSSEVWEASMMRLKKMLAKWWHGFIVKVPRNEITFPRTRSTASNNSRDEHHSVEFENF